MAVESVIVADGPNLHDAGVLRGTVDITITDGRVFRRLLSAISQVDWDAKLAALGDDQLEKVARQDADAESDNNNEIAAVKEASREQVALAYLRKAYSLGDPYKAYIKFDRFNDYRLDKGWSLNQVVTNLAAVGLEQAEWDLMEARYIYLSNAQRVTAMQNFQLVLNGDTWGDEFR